MDSAKSDGASNMTIFRRIVCPLAKPTVMLAVLFAFTGSRNGLVWPQLLLAGGSVVPKGRYIDYINTDNDSGCRLVARHLSKFHSGKKYVYISDDYEYSNSRYSAFYDELITLESDAEVIKFDISRDDTTFLYEKIAAGYRNLFCYNDMIAYEILKRLDDLVVDVRRMFPDLHVVGFDGLCTRLPGLKQITTVGIDYRRYAEIVYEMVRNRLEAPDKPAGHVMIPVTLHQRKKIKSPRRLAIILRADRGFAL